jgi:hypothetical protein
MKILCRVILPLAALLRGLASAAGAESPSTIPLTLTESDYGGGRIYATVRFGNVMGPMRIDTGASTTRIRLAPWNKDLPSLGRSLSTGASGETARCEDVEAQSVELKASEGNNIARARYEVSRCDASAGDDLLGLDFFRGARFTLDFDRKEMVFFAATSAAGRPKPFRLLGPDRRLVGIETRVGGVTVVGLFDTGAEIAAVDRQFVEKHTALFAPVTAQGEAREAGGGHFSRKIYKIKAIDLGDGRILRGVYIMAYDFGLLREALGRRAPLILGVNILRQFNWELDFKAPDSPTWEAKPK